IETIHKGIPCCDREVLSRSCHTPASVEHQCCRNRLVPRNGAARHINVLLQNAVFKYLDVLTGRGIRGLVRAVDPEMRFYCGPVCTDLCNEKIGLSQSELLHAPQRKEQCEINPT